MDINKLKKEKEYFELLRTQVVKEFEITMAKIQGALDVLNKLEKEEEEEENGLSNQN